MVSNSHQNQFCIFGSPACLGKDSLRFAQPILTFLEIPNVFFDESLALQIPKLENGYPRTQFSFEKGVATFKLKKYLQAQNQNCGTFKS
ncbi:MAG: hypothetical protein DCF20_15440 [Pseudanabaena sp.]|nr:MAG: hypothetical protein DCF20_15440 [Pseudanabaena sp.]